MPPVGAYVSVLSVSRDRTTASRHSPSYVHRLAHSRQYASVASSDTMGSTGCGVGRCDCRHTSTKGTWSPSPTLKSATVDEFSPRSSTGVRSHTESGPATATRSGSSRRTHGHDVAVVEPQPQVHAHG